MTWATTEVERARGYAELAPPPRLSLARRLFPGLLAAAATAGVVVGDGWRNGTEWTPFIQLGAAVLAARVGAALPASVHALVGVVTHTFWFVLWGFCFTAVAQSLRGGKLFIAAIVVTGALALLARVFFPRALGAAELSLMSSAHTALYLTTIAIALSLGTRLARYA